jgi:hypothetical protein
MSNLVFGTQICLCDLKLQLVCKDLESVWQYMNMQIVLNEIVSDFNIVECRLKCQMKLFRLEIKF